MLGTTPTMLQETSADPDPKQLALQSLLAEEWAHHSESQGTGPYLCAVLVHHEPLVQLLAAALAALPLLEGTPPLLVSAMAVDSAVPDRCLHRWALLGDGGAAAPFPDALRGVPAGGLGRVQCVVAHASLAADPSFPFAQFQTVVDYEPQELSPHPLPPSLPPALKAAFSHNPTRSFQLRRVWPGGNPVRDALRAGALPSAWGTALQGLLGPGTPSVDRIVPYRLLHDLYTRSGDATLLGEGWC